MEYSEAIKEARSRWREILPHITGQAKKKVNGETSYICPFCGHGNHGDGMTFDPGSKDGNMLHCFGSCGFSGDIIDVIAQSQGIEFYAALEEACSFIGITVDKQQKRTETPYNSGEQSKGNYSTQQAKTSQDAAESATEPQTDYTEFYIKAHKSNTGAYLESRGISKEVQDLFCVGYDEKWKNPNGSQYAIPAPYVIFPTSKNTYVARYAGAGKTDYKKMRVGRNAPMFCSKKALERDGAIFIVEGETDALSFWEIDKISVATGSTSNAQKAIEFAKSHKDRAYIIAMDNDGAGKAARDKIYKELIEAGIKCDIADLNGSYKDPNDFLVYDKFGFIKAAKLAELKLIDPDEYKRQMLEKNNVAEQIPIFWEEVQDENRNKPISTGFSLLDTALDGGFYPEQLVFMGAISSLGKTTLLLQIMDNIAAAGTPCMFFSLEMSRNEIMSKSISRFTLTISIDESIDRKNAKTMRGILSGHKNYNRTEHELVQKASEKYRDVGHNIYIYEGRGETGVHEIIEQVKEFIRLTQKKPVVFIDYLQILAPSDPRATDKQNTDVAVKLLKQLARDEAIPIIAISSLNRDNYSRPISMEAFKESGAVEYSSDVLIGLQLKGVGTKDFDVNEAKRQDPREVELHILKNRNGVMSAPILYYYYPKFNFYHEIELIKREVKEKKTAKPAKVV